MPRNLTQPYTFEPEDATAVRAAIGKALIAFTGGSLSIDDQEKLMAYVVELARAGESINPDGSLDPGKLAAQALIRLRRTFH